MSGIEDSDKSVAYCLTLVYRELNFLLLCVFNLGHTEICAFSYNSLQNTTHALRCSSCAYIHCQHKW